MRLFVFILILLVSFFGYSQTDIPKSKKLNVKAAIPNKGTPLKTTTPLNYKKPDFTVKKEKPGIQMYPTTNLVQAGHGLKLDPKIRKKEKKGDKSYYPDMYLGDIKSTAKFVGIVCRDFGEIDGDRIKISLNGKVVEPNIYLTGTFKGVNVDLDKGFNRIVFEAITQGSLGPNTAQVNVYDDIGELIYSNTWNLSTGAKATFIIVKE
ncbi:MAG: hypothetical protein V3U92_08395 [Cellulophaga sp.]